MGGLTRTRHRLLAGHGIARIERLVTNNTFAYRYSLGGVGAAQGIRQKLIRPHRSCQNGSVERLNRTLQTESAYRQVSISNAERTAARSPWVEHYNTERRHGVLGRAPPISRP